MRKSRAADIHDRYLEVMRRFADVDCDELVRANAGGFVWMLLSGLLFLELSCTRPRFVIARAAHIEVWNVAPTGSIPSRRSHVFRQPEITIVNRGVRYDRVRIAGRKYLISVGQRPYLSRLMSIGATVPTTGMVGCPAGWYRNPWALPGLGGQLRYWDGSGWTGHVDPPTGSSG
ncbi:MAG: DUF2510 domain-containing protein [Candidatus Nanopelagicales bacterium]|nr:DUF2510 domain-containing protein [Candidatus Nanopelagicales bacterium]